MEQLNDREYGISVGREMAEGMAFSLAMQGQKKPILLQMRLSSRALSALLIVELQVLQGAAQVGQSSFPNSETKGRKSHKSDSQYFMVVEGQRWGMESHPGPLQLSRTSGGTSASWKCPCFYLDTTSAHSQSCAEGIMSMFSCQDQIFLANPSCLVKNVYVTDPYIIKNAGIFDKI